MKKFTSLLPVLLLSACAASSGIGLQTLETPQYLRSARSVDLGFVEIQRALFQHQAACNTDIQWAGNTDGANYVRITMPFEPGSTGWNNTIVLGLTHMANVETKAEIFSYRTPTSAQIRRLYGAILDPENCSA